MLKKLLVIFVFTPIYCMEELQIGQQQFAEESAIYPEDQLEYNQTAQVTAAPGSVKTIPGNVCGDPGRMRRFWRRVWRRTYYKKPICCPKYRCCRPKPDCCPMPLPPCPKPECIVASPERCGSLHGCRP